MSGRVLITGANGFVGKAVARVLQARGIATAGLVRVAGTAPDVDIEWVSDAADFSGIDERWMRGLHCDSVVHLAARVHMMSDDSRDALAAYRATNVEGALRVARAARRSGAKRFVYVSSIKAVAESSAGESALDEQRSPAPCDPYGISKLEAEQALRSYGAESGLEIVIVRPPLVYGPHVRANFLQLMRTVSSGLPLPLGALDGRRSLVFVDNLADALARCTVDPRAAGQTFHVTDGEDMSVTELVRGLARHLNAPARLLPVPVSWLRLAGLLTGRAAQVERLVGELRVSSARIRDVLEWEPPYTVDAGLRSTADWYRRTH
ncbi:NAD-dependent epimerase/dehydratase family protein [Burkholderia multivorans]|uniref:NAD-dependent epimerase/dehydratase family protein n=1 Tax=Burkholderia multivorans TaxID=87883 RepID=UPI0021C1ACE9|nr:NAD-dependent epimerase/dehydratase family protein [Burkholderia multivorans]MCA8374192.1 NAD-dependent epimerase/dehydratase family protein [Burkholderia multivorans]